MPRKPKTFAIKWSKPCYNLGASLHLLKVSFVPSSLKSFYLRTFLYVLYGDILQRHHRILIFKCTKFLQFSTFFFQGFILKHGLKQNYKMGFSLSSWSILHCWVSYVLFIIPMEFGTFKPIT